MWRCWNRLVLLGRFLLYRYRGEKKKGEPHFHFLPVVKPIGQRTLRVVVVVVVVGLY